MSWENEIVMRDITKASLVVSDRIGRDVSAQLDLEEALEASRYTSHPYSTHPREWPPLVEVVDSRELPSVLIERYNAAGGEGTALCGIFPEIRRAWASVDNSLFLWRFDKWDGQCPEYNGEEQAICAVGLVKAKPGIFVEAIQYLLVLATPVELLLIGVCCSGSGDGTDPYAEVTLQPLPEYTIPSDGVTMTCIACTNRGHIFLAGRDGHIYEMHYTTGSSWHKHCRKVCLTAGLGSVVSRWVVPNVFKFGAVDPIVEMAVDNERHILYARTEEMKIQVYSLGPNGDGPLKKVTEEKNLINQRGLHNSGRQSAGSRAPSLGTGVRSSRALRECVSSLPIEGRMLSVAEVLPLPDTAATVQPLYSQLEFCGYDNFGESSEKLAGKLWARGDHPTQHILPRRRIIIFSTMGMMEVVFNRPVDILSRLLESNTPRTILEDFFNRYGAGEAAAMCLMLAARIVHMENFINNVVEKAAEAFEDPRIVGIPRLEGSGALSNTRTAAGGFSMGQVVQEAEPVFSGAHEGLCMLESRLLLPVWELPVMVTGSGLGSDATTGDGIVVCRLSVGAMQVLEDKLRSLEKFLRSRRNQRRGLFASVSGLGDLTGCILFGIGADLVTGDRNMARNLFSPYSGNLESSEAGTSNKRQWLPYSPTELASMEARAMECVRQLLLRCGEALFLLQLLSRHNVTRLLQGFDGNTKQALVQLTFHQLVCSEEGDRLATRHVSALMEYYTGPDGRGTVDDISGSLAGYGKVVQAFIKNLITNSTWLWNVLRELLLLLTMMRGKHLLEMPSVN